MIRKLELARFFVALCFDRVWSLAQHHAIPTIHYVQMDVELIENPHRRVVDQVLEILRMIIESN